MDSGALDAEFFGLAIDALAGCALIVEGAEERAVAVEGDPLNTAEFPVDILDAAFAFGELRMLAGLAGFLRKEQGALEALSVKAIGVVELHGGMHGQANGTERGAITQPLKRRFGGLPERNSRDARVTSSGVVDIPRIIGSISGQVGGVLIEGSNGLTIQGAEIHDIVFVKRPGIFSQDDIAIVRGVAAATPEP